MAFNDTWTGAISTDWNTAANWNTAPSTSATAPPTSTDTATINAGSRTDTVAGSGALESATLTLSSTGAGSVDLTGSCYTGYNSGSLNLTGFLQLNGTIYDYGTATFANGATLDGGTTSVQGAATFGSGFTLENAELDLSTSSTATLSTLTLIGATTLSGDVTTTALSDSAATSLTLGTGTFDVSGSSPSVPALLPALTIKGYTTLEGTFNSTSTPCPSLTVLGGAELYLNAGDSLTAATATFDPSGYVSLTDGTLTITGNASFGSSLTVTGAGSFTVDGTLTTQNGSINASNSSRVEINALTGTSGGLTLTSDATSTIEIGGQNVGTAGSITIDSGVSFTESGTFSAPVIADNGTITVAPNSTLTLYGNSSSRGLTGTGQLNIDQGSSLTLNGVDPGTSDQVTIDFAQTGGQLWLASDDFDALGNFKPTITGFGATDVIEYQGTATSGSYSSGYLSLYNGANLVAKFNIGSGYSGDTFSTVAIAGGYTQVDLAGTPKVAPAGTTTADSYQWVGPVAGNWNAKANWNDVTAEQNPAAVAPGKNDLVTIGAAANGAAQVVIGNGDAYSLTLGGETLLEGQFNVGAGGFSESTSASVVLYSGSALDVAGNATFGTYAGVTLNGGAMSVTGTGALTGGYGNSFVIENGGSLSAAQIADYYYDSYSVLAGDALTVAGGVSDGASGYDSSFTINGGTFTVRGTFTSTNDAVYAENGGKAQIASLTEDSHGNGVTLDVEDATSSIEIGTTGGVAAGTITIDAGQTVTEQGAFYAPTIVDAGTLNIGTSQSLSVSGTLEDEGGVTIGANGQMTVSGALQLSANVTIGAGGVLTQNGAITGAGKVTIDAGAKLSLSSDSSGTAVTIAFSGAGDQLAINSYNDLNASNVFVPTITGFGAADVIDFTDPYATITSAQYAAGKLNLYAGSTVVATLNLSGTYTNAFSVLPVSGGSTYQIDYLGGGTNAAPAGTTSADSYQWVGPVAGNWNAKANWDDVTAGQNPASVAPGKNDLVTIAAAAGGAAQVVVGNGNAYSLALGGETLLDGVFKIGAGGLTLASSASAYLYSGSSLSVAGNATFSSYAGVTLNGGAMSVTGTGALTGGYGNSFVIENGGSLTAAQLVDYYYDSYSVLAGDTLTVTGGVSDGASGYDSSFTINGGTFTVGGTFTSTNDAVYAENGGKAQIASLTEDSHGNGVTLYVYDATSSIEIGTTGGVAAGTITIDAGQTVTEQGSFYASSGTIVDKGVLNVGAGQSLNVSGTLEVDGSVTIGVGGTLTQSGAMTGAGKVTIGAGAKLSLSSDSSGTAVTIAFSGAGDQLAINSYNDLNASNVFVPTITGFGAADVIDFTDPYATITSAQYAAGKLNLYAGSTVVATLNLSGTYTNAFSVLPVSGGSTYQIDYLGGGTNAAPAGTTSADSYQWVGPVAGNWNAKANWDDVTAGQNPASVAPGKNDLVTIAAAAGGAAQVVVGNGNAYSLALGGETLLDGVFKIGAGGLTLASSASAYLYSGSSLSVAGNATFSSYAGVTLNGGAMSVTGTGALTGGYGNSFVIENGGSLTAAQLVDYYYDSYSVLAGDTLTVTGGVSDGASGYDSSFTINGGTFTVGGTFTSTNDAVYAENGGKAQIASLTEDSHGNGVTLYVYDATSSIEIGTTGGVAAGTITIDAGQTVTEQGSFYASSGTIVDKGVLNVGAGQSLNVSGTLEVDGSVTIGVGGTLTQSGAMTGAGKVTIGAGAKLSLSSDSSGTAVTIAFSGAGDQLAINSYNDLNASNVFVPTITGFGAADVIDFTDPYATITSAQYAAGKLNLYAGSTVVATLNLSGTYTNYFSTVPLNGGSTYQIDYEGGAPKTTAPAGTTTGDSFQWVGPVAGFWSTKANWDDTTQGQNPAAVAPGANDTVTIAAAANGEAQVIVGNANAYGLTLEGETLLLGTFNVVGTGAKGGLTATSSASAIFYGGSSISISGDATFGSYAGETMNGGAMTVTGTQYAGYASSFVVENGGSLSAAQLVDYYYGSYSVLTGGTVTVNGNVSDGSSGYDSSYSVNGGTFTVKGIFVSTSDAVYSQNGGKVQLAALQQDVHGNGATLDVEDTTSSIEIGTAGGAAAGTLTIDGGRSVTESGTFYAPTIVDNGALTVAAGESLYLYGALAGSGSVSIDAGSTLTLSGASASGTDTIAFAGAGGTLKLGDAPGLPNGMTLTGWVSGENLDVQGVTDAAYVGGSLVLYDNGSTVGSFKVGTSYAGDSFDVVPLGNGYSQITLGPSWLNPVSGNFATAADWSTGSIPGSTDSVAISTAGTYTVSVASSTTVRSIEESDSGATVNIGLGDVLTLSGVSNINGAIAGTGTLRLAGGVTSFDGSGSMSVAAWQLSGAGTNVTLGQVLNYSGNFQAGSGTSVTVSGGNLTLTGQASFAGATVSGADTLFAQGTSSVSGLTVGGTATFDNAGTLTQNGGMVTVGDAAGNVAELLNASTGTWDITDNSSINLGLSAASSTTNDGLFEKTGGTGTSMVELSFANAHNLLVSSGTLDFQGAVSGTGTDTIQGASTLEFQSTLSAGQTINFTGASSGTLDLFDPLGYGGSHIGGFVAGDNVDLNGAWSLLSFGQNAGGTLGTLTLTNGTSQAALEFAGSFVQSNFSIATGGTTIIGHT